MKIYRMVLCVMILSLSTLTAYAHSWPIFSPPDLNLLLSLHDIDTSTCPPGQGKLVDHASINILIHSCKSYCPRIWEWVTSSDNTCHELTDFMVKGNDIAHYEDNDNTISYSEISVYYGEKAANQSVNKIIFTSAPHDHWFCVEIDSGLHDFTCTNDIL